MDRIILVHFDTSILVTLPYDPNRTVTSQLDDYAKQYAMDRAHLTGILVDHVTLDKAA